jgi:hypothetical protein
MKESKKMKSFFPLPRNALDIFSARRSELACRFNVSGRIFPRKVKLCSSAYCRMARRRDAARCLDQKKMESTTGMQMAITIASVLTLRSFNFGCPY